jgi:FkbM family methyltransferase
LSDKSLVSFVPSILDQTRKYPFSKKTFAKRIEEEVYLLDKIQHYLRDIDCFFDVGANIGMTSLAINYMWNSQLPIYMFEPMHSCYPVLDEIVELNKNIVSNKFGLGRKSETLSFNRSLSSETSQASSFLKFSKSYLNKIEYANAEIEETAVLVKSLDAYCSENQLSFRKGCLHIDVEGFEYQVLEGATQRLADFEVLIIEVTNGLFEGQKSLNDIIRFLDNSHSLVGAIASPMYRGGELILQDFLFKKNPLQ